MLHWFSPSPFQGEGRGEGRSICRVANIFSNPFFIVPKPNHQPGGSLLVS